MNYCIRKANLEDLPVILNLRDQAREIMRSYGNVYQRPQHPHRHAQGQPRHD